MVYKPYDDGTEEYFNFFLKGDEVTTPEGWKGRVIGTKGSKVDVYLTGETRLETYQEKDLELTNELQIGVTSDKKDWTKSMYSGISKKWCNHWMDKFDIGGGYSRETVGGGHSVYLSARSTPSKDRQGDKPDYGCYMDRGWMNSCSLWLTPNAPTDDEIELFDVPDIPSMYIDWPDMGRIPLRLYSQVIVWCVSRIQESKKLEIACYGGHGRTGTVLAGLLVYYGLDGHEAIKRVRGDYCKSAIESKTQEDLIVEYSKQLRELDNGSI